MKTFILLVAALAAFVAVTARGAESGEASTVRIVGEVRYPGTYRIQADSTIWSVVQDAKGVADMWGGVVYVSREVDGKTVRLMYRSDTRRMHEGTKEYWSSIRVLPGDTLFFQEIIC